MGVTTRALAYFTIIGIVVYVAIDVSLRFLRPEYSLLHNAESDYGRGPWFWVMDLNFLLRCALTLALVEALRRGASAARMRRGLMLLALWGTCSGLLAFFADDVEGQPVRGSGTVHLALAFVAFIAVAIATVSISVALRTSRPWQHVVNMLTVISSLGVVALLLLGRSAGRVSAPGGLYERIFLGLELLWMGVVAVSLLRLAPDEIAAEGYCGRDRLRATSAHDIG